MFFTQQKNISFLYFHINHFIKSYAPILSIVHPIKKIAVWKKKRYRLNKIERKQGEREIRREREIGRQREKESEKARERDRQRERQKETERDRERQRET
jgi:hypothetical protein